MPMTQDNFYLNSFYHASSSSILKVFVLTLLYLFCSSRYVVRALKMLLAFERNKGQRWPWTLVISVYLLISFCSTSTNAFNVDVNSKVIHQAPGRNCVAGDCMFGFSVAQHREQGQPW